MFRSHLRTLRFSWLLLLAACASVPSHIEPPRVSLAGLQLTGGSLLEQRYHLKLRAENPNPFDLPLEQLTYQVKLNGQPFTAGTSTQPVVLPKNGSAVIDLDGSGSLLNLLGQLTQLPGTAGRLHYTLDGTAKLQHLPVTFPFHRSGDVDLLR